MDPLPNIVVFSMGRVGSHTCRDFIRRTVDPRCFVIHNVCRYDKHMGGSVYDPEQPPEGYSEERREVARRLVDGAGVKVVVPARNPVDRAISAWRYFKKGRGPLETADMADDWWGEQLYEVLRGNQVVVIKLEQVAKALPMAVGMLMGEKVEWDGTHSERATVDEVPEITEGFVSAAKFSETVSLCGYSEEDIDERVEWWRRRRCEARTDPAGGGGGEG